MGRNTAHEWDWKRSIDLLEKVIKREPPERYYRDEFPEQYPYKETLAVVMRELLEKCSDTDVVELRKRIESLQAVVREQDDVIRFMEQSKFWKYRRLYLKMQEKIRALIL